MTLFHSVMNSDDEQISKKIIEQQQKEKLKNTMYKRVKDIAKKLEINVAKVEAIKKSTRKRLAKYKMKSKIEKRLKREMEGKAKPRTIKEDKWKMKEQLYFKLQWRGCKRHNADKTTYVGSTNEL